MTVLFANNANTTLAAGITSSATSISLATGTGSLFPSPSGGNFYIATLTDAATGLVNEIVHVTAMSGDVATVVRAQEGTTGHSYLTGDYFNMLVTAGTMQQFFQKSSMPVPQTALTYGVAIGASYSGSVSVTLSPTPPVAGYLVAQGSLNLGAQAAAAVTATLSINGTTQSYDVTEMSQTHYGVAAVAAGGACVAQLTVTSGTTSPAITGSYQVLLYFVPT